MNTATRTRLVVPSGCAWGITATQNPMYLNVEGRDVQGLGGWRVLLPDFTSRTTPG